jgi:hypothetical protein
MRAKCSNKAAALDQAICANCRNKRIHILRSCVETQNIAVGTYRKIQCACLESVIHCVECLVLLCFVENFRRWDRACTSAENSLEKDVRTSPPDFDGVACFVLWGEINTSIQKLSSTTLTNSEMAIARVISQSILGILQPVIRASNV